MTCPVLFVSLQISPSHPDDHKYVRVAFLIQFTADPLHLLPVPIQMSLFSWKVTLVHSVLSVRRLIEAAIPPLPIFRELSLGS